MHVSGNSSSVYGETLSLRSRLNQGQPILLQSGTIVSMDPAIGVLQRGDILIRGNRIEAIAPHLVPPADALVLDVSRRLILPGLIDGHRHTWETVLRGVGGDWTLLDYFTWMVKEFGQHFRPEDIYAANLLASIESLDNGVTAFGDWSDAGRTPEHIEAAVKALENSGIRGRFHYANVYGPAQEWATTPHVEKMWARYGSVQGRISMQMGIDSTRDPSFPEASAWRFAQERGIPVATHAGLFGWDNMEWIGKLYKHGFMKPDVTYIHALAIPDEFVNMIKDTGGTITMATCSNCNSGQGYPNVSGLCQHGIPLGLGSDTDMRWDQSMFEVMRTTLNVDRAYQHMQAHKRGYLQPYNELRSESVLEMATLGGARALGLSEVAGSLSPGKLADIIVLKPNDCAMPLHLNPTAHAVFQGTTERVETVIVDGRFVKYGGELVEHNRKRIIELANQSREYLIAQIGEDKIRATMQGPSTAPSAPAPKTL
ncbi:amidohydrolase (plasmid) [Serratia marcescens]|nr:amidohydrolase [Serratia marcescens]